LFRLITLEDIVRIPPELYGKPIEYAIKSLLVEKYEGVVFYDLGFVAGLVSFEFDYKGKLAPGDGGSYHKTKFKVLAFVPEVQEVMLGRVVEIEEYGAFVRIGPFEALLHVSSVMDDYVDFNKAQATLTGRKNGRVLSVGDLVRLRVTAVSIGGATGGDRIGVTTRQPFLGKIDWVEQDLKKLATAEKASGEAA
jgi:DNA-directed RNA polymerase subunit E'